MTEDHLDSSPSETVRRHAATFRSVRERLARADALAVEARTRAPSSELPDMARGGRAWASDGDGLRVLGARSAAKVAEDAARSGWRVVVRVGQARRDRDAAWFDSAVVVGYRGGGGNASVPPGGVTSSSAPPPREYVLGHWRADPVIPPMKRKWKFTGATASDAERGTRPVGGRELAAIVGS